MSINVDKKDVVSMIKILEGALKNQNINRKQNFVDYSKTISTFLNNLSLCKNKNYTQQIGKIVHKSIIILQNLYICVESAKLEGIQLKELVGVDQEYKKRLIEILKTPKKDENYCKIIKNSLDMFFADFNKILEPYKLDSVKLEKTCGFQNTDGEFTTFRQIIEDLSVESKEIMDDYYVLYNGIIFYTYLGGLPITKNLYVVAQTIFQFCGALACKLSSAQLVSICRRFVQALSGEEIKIQDHFTVLESLISFICKTTDIYSRSYMKLTEGDFEFDDFVLIVKNIDGILQRSDKYYKLKSKYSDEIRKKIKEDIVMDKNKNIMSNQINKINKKVQERIVRNLPIPETMKPSFVQTFDNPLNQALAVAVVSSTDKKGMAQARKILSYYNPLVTTKMSALHKRVNDRDFEALFFQKGNKSYVFKPNGRTAFLGFTWMLTSNLVKLSEYLQMGFVDENER